MPVLSNSLLKFNQLKTITMNITKAFCLSMALFGAANIQAMENSDSDFIIQQDNTKVNNYQTNRPEAAKRLFVSQAVEQQLSLIHI